MLFMHVRNIHHIYQLRVLCCAARRWCAVGSFRKGLKTLPEAIANNLKDSIR